MSKVLQIRRGTTAQNDVFTGLSGEITVDTEQHTIRVHDETTRGGFTLARLDQIIGFDIDSVPDEWWAAKIPQFCPSAFTILSETVQCDCACYIEALFDTDVQPKFVTASMVAEYPSAGYAVGDIVGAFGITDIPSNSPNWFIDENGLHVRLMTGQKSFWVVDKTTGDKTIVENSDWAIKFGVYC